MLDTKAFRSLSYGLYIVSSKRSDGSGVGCVVNTFQQVASTPPMVSVSLNKENATTKIVEQTGGFCISVLSEAATMDLIGQFGFRTSDDLDKFDGIESAVCGKSIPYVTQHSCARFTVEVKQTLDVGTHIMFVGEVVESEVLSNERPMTYAYYHEVLRGKTPPKAASYEGGESDDDAGDAHDAAPDASEKSPTRVGWRCTLCGHIVEIDELPDDFCCPICGMGKSFFERVEL